MKNTTQAASPERALETVRSVAPPPTLGRPVEVAAGLFLLRLPLPFALNHINVYLLDDGDGWAVVDCGLDTEESRACWRTALNESPFRGRPIRRVIATHHHPDHVGLAGWLCQRADVPLEISAGELAASWRYANPARDPHGERVDFWTVNGMPRDVAVDLAAQMPNYLRAVHPFPEAIEKLGDAPIDIGGRRWHPVIGRGHSPEHISLFCMEEDLLLSGDHVLPRISPNIGVWPDGPQDPLGDYLETLQPFAALGRDPLVLPSHHDPFHGLAARVRQLEAHHVERLERLETACGVQALSCYETLPSLFNRPLKREQLGFAMSEGLAHLHRLERAGRVALQTLDGVRRFNRR